ncbi:hypothetical protein Drose_37635 [Dactylosporangium roseum]|uniref:Uncharacterized protein n=1 Tax=Dactylosporangium roseum TaxID=47989 RepID=A0ABY5Z3P8_9ACTN|nr:hypothetical protein [Dactylosporangium roseum]UWZ36654.1 hypothetical protein Drose_37635 [Dactylosporangium roseum]
MPEQEPKPADMIEWSNPPAGPDMAPPAPVAAPVAAPEPSPVTEPPAAQRPNPIAYALLAIGFGLALAAQYLPWSSFQTGVSTADDDTRVSPTRRQIPSSVDINLANLNTGHVVAYLSTIVLALCAIAILLSADGVVRRTATAAAGGLLAGNLLVLVGFKSAIDNLGMSSSPAFALPDDAISVGAGYPVAVSAALLLAAGVIVAARGPLLRGRRGFGRKIAEEPENGGPLDLTVTPVPPNHLR